MDFLLLYYYMEQRVLMDQHKTESAIDQHSPIPLLPFFATLQLLFLLSLLPYQRFLILILHFLSAFSVFILPPFFYFLLLSSLPPLQLSFSFLLLWLATSPLFPMLTCELLPTFSLLLLLISFLVYQQLFPSHRQ